MRACVQCGAENPDDAVTCRSCGAAQGTTPAAAAPSVSAPPTEPAISQPSLAQPGPAQPSPATEPAGHATPQGQWFERSQSADTMVAGQPLGATAMTSAAGTSAERRDASATPLRRGDVVVLLGALLLFIDSFLPFYDFGYGASTNAWTWTLLPLLLMGFGTGVLAGVLVALERFTTVGNVAGKVGLTLHQLVGVLAVVSAVDLTLYVISAPLRGVAQWLGLVGAALLLVGSVLAKHVPALSMPVGASVAGRPGAAPAGPGGPAAAPAGAPFWFSVPVPTPVHDRADGSLRGELQPGRWYLATAFYGTAAEVSAEEFGTAILHDLTRMQRA